ncbi:restriction endonuclease subunit S [Nonomuraea sp. KC401]|uniref:restriction endonuclease subunit S n=1 Tax=unclassified Nonomuraea TaxID=2593643 RepID=UPI0010FDEA52|nr:MULTISPECIES: restriction endonuclease subunit S [unclassified Nonomuraea]NBE95202.1 restriction endonuclease subunit S [Nonomuraea sp. K271]TLF71167.1 restriction endonuclease subunit S [Nonomuraea sp. KC401]
MGEIARIAKEVPTSPGERVVGLEHLESGVLTVRKWAGADLGHTFTRRFDAGHVLFGRRRAYQRKAARAEFAGVCSGDILVLEALPGVDPLFLPLVMQSAGLIEHAVTRSAGSLSPRTNWRALAEYQLSLPDLEEQERIARLVWAAETVTVRTEHAAAAAWDVEKRVLEDAYNDPSWPMVRTDEAGEAQLGRMQHPKYQTGQHLKPYLRVANVGDDQLVLDDVLHMDFDQEHFRKYSLKSGDILLNEGQSTELVGRCTMYQGEIEGCCYQKSLLRFRVSEGVEPEFAYGWFRRAFYRGDFARNSTKTTSLANLTAVRFKKMPFPLPPLEVQRKIVERVAEAREVRRRLEEHAANSRRLVHALIDRILGEDDPPDELR